MELTSLFFIPFVLLFCLVYYLIPKKAQWVILLIASLAFFVLSSGILVVYMMASTAIIYFGALWISNKNALFEIQKKSLDKKQRKEAKKQLKRTQKVRVASVSIAVLSILIVLKYCNFGVEIANCLSGLFHFGVVFDKFSIILPIGISYYTLMSVSYVTDVYRGIIQAERNPFRVLLFVCYFPHITEGPFDRYKELSAQFCTPHKFHSDSFCRGLLLIFWGLFKKIVIADRLGITVSEVFNQSSENAGFPIILATLMYTVQLYCDFSGCIDIVSGVSGLFGIKIAENFRQPFFAKSISEFWRRWHISLGLWLKEYVYYPVILSGHFKAVDRFIRKHVKSNHLINVIPAAYALFFVWFTNGLWHGASIKYVLYGLYYYFLMMLGELCRPLFDKLKAILGFRADNRLFCGFQVVRTFVIVNIGMLLFRSSTIGEFWYLINQSFAFSFQESVAKSVQVLLGAKFAYLGIALLLVISILKEKNLFGRVMHKTPYVVKFLVILFLFVYLYFVGVYGPSYNVTDFVYAQF